MPDVVVNAPPFIPVKPLIKIGTTGTSVEIACAAEELSVEVDQDEVDTETFCGSFKSYKSEVWTITVSVFPSYGTAGLWNNLRPLAGTSQPFEIRPDGVAVAGPTNPSMVGTCRVKAFPFYMGRLGEPTAFDVELGVQGAPTFALALAAATEAFAQAELDAQAANEGGGVVAGPQPAETVSV
jgi:hypothetical protein